MCQCTFGHSRCGLLEGKTFTRAEILPRKPVNTPCWFLPCLIFNVRVFVETTGSGALESPFISIATVADFRLCIVSSNGRKMNWDCARPSFPFKPSLLFHSLVLLLPDGFYPQSNSWHKLNLLLFHSWGSSFTDERFFFLFFGGFAVILVSGSLWKPVRS